MSGLQYIGLALVALFMSSAGAAESFFKDTEQEISKVVESQVIAGDSSIDAQVRFFPLTRESLISYVESEIRNQKLQESLSDLDHRVTTRKLKDWGEHLSLPLLGGVTSGGTAGALVWKKYDRLRNDAAQVLSVLDNIDVSALPPEGSIWSDAVENREQYEVWRRAPHVFVSRGRLQLPIEGPLSTFPIISTSIEKWILVRYTVLEAIADEIFSPSDISWESVRLLGQEPRSLKDLIVASSNRITFPDSDFEGTFQNRKELIILLERAQRKVNSFRGYSESLEIALDASLPGPSAFKVPPVDRMDATWTARLVQKESTPGSVEKLLRKAEVALEQLEKQRPFTAVRDWSDGWPEIQTIQDARFPMRHLPRLNAAERLKNPHFLEISKATEPNIRLRAGGVGTSVFALVSTGLLLSMLPKGPDVALLSEAPRRFNPWTEEGRISKEFISMAVEKFKDEIQSRRAKNSNDCMRDTPCIIPLPILDRLPEAAETVRSEFPNESKIQLE